MKNIFAAQEAQRKKENNDFKEEIKDMISEGIKCEVEKATKPIKESQEKILQDQASLLRTVEELQKKVVEIEKENEDKEYPRLKKPQDSESNRKSVNVERKAKAEELTQDQKTVRGLFRMSNLTVGLSPITKEFVEAEIVKQTEETGADEDTIKAKVIKEAVKEFMIMEMKVKEEHFEKLNIVRSFTPQKSDWHTVYVELESQDQVDWLMGHTK